MNPMNRYSTILFIFLFSISGFSQDNSDLNTWNDESLPFEERQQAGLKYAWRFGALNTDKGLEIVNTLLEEENISKLSPDDLFKTEHIQLKLISIKNEQEFIPKFKIEYEKAAQSKETEEAAYWSYAVAFESQFIDDYHTSVEYFLISIQYYEKLKDKRMMGKIYRNLSFIHGTTENYDQAIETAEMGIKLFDEMSDTSEIINLKARECSFYLELGDTLTAELVITEAQNLAKALNDPFWINFCRGPKSQLLTSMEKYEEALIELIALNEYYQDFEDPRMLSYSYATLCDAYMNLNQYDNAVEAAETGLKVALDNQLIKEKMDNLEVIHLAYYHNGQYKKAYEYYDQYLAIRDELKGAENIADINIQLADFEQAKEAYADSLVQAKKDYQLQLEHEREVSNEKKQKYVAGGVIFVFFLGGSGLFFVLRRTKKHNVQLAEQKEIVESQKNEIVDSIKYAKRIQSAILPPNKIVKTYLEDSFILYKPKDIVAGDFYWMQAIGEDVIFAAADCTGHGVPGALVSVVCHNALNRSVKEFKLKNPDEILNKTRALVIEEFEKSDDEVKDGMDIALCVLNQQKLKYAGAHNPLWLIRKGEFEADMSENRNTVISNGHTLLEIKADKQPIGKGHREENFTLHECELKEGDRIYIFSDGFADQFGGEQGKKFKSKGFKKLLLSIQGENMNNQKQLIDEAFENWKGNLEQLDDVCIIGVQM